MVASRLYFHQVKVMHFELITKRDKCGTEEDLIALLELGAMRSRIAQALEEVLVMVQDFCGHRQS